MAEVVLPAIRWLGVAAVSGALNCAPDRSVMSILWDNLWVERGVSARDRLDASTFLTLVVSPDAQGQTVDIALRGAVIVPPADPTQPAVDATAPPPRLLLGVTVGSNRFSFMLDNGPIDMSIRTALAVANETDVRLQLSLDGAEVGPLMAALDSADLIFVA